MTTHLPLEMIHPGELMPVTVIGITQNGAIVQIDNTEYTAFIHISKIAKGYVREVSDYISIGDKLDAMGSNKGFKPELIYSPHYLSKDRLLNSITDFSEAQRIYLRITNNKERYRNATNK